MPITFDIDDIINPPDDDRFCDLYPFPVVGNGGFRLYYQAVPGGQLVAIGGRIKSIETASGIIDVMQLIAFSSPGKLRDMFPQAFEKRRILDDVEGVPMQCRQIYVPLPAFVPVSYRIEALKNADTVVSFPINGNIPDAVNPPDDVNQFPVITVPADHPGGIYTNETNHGDQYTNPPAVEPVPAESGKLPLIVFGFIASLLK